MTATIKPPERDGRPRRRVPRFSSLESLGFSDSAHVWSDSPRPVPLMHLGPQSAPPTEPDLLADWQPTEVGGRLTGRNFRWSLVVAPLLLAGAVAAFGWWLYQRPIENAQASSEAVVAQAETLQATLPALEELNSGLLKLDETTEIGALTAVDTAARDLFSGSGDLDPTNAGARSAAASASSAALEASRLTGDAHAYQLAVAPILLTPEMITDPEAIALDDAARTFGDWQLTFDDTRTALPAGILADVTVQIALISEDLPMLLTDYVEALRADSQDGADAVLDQLAARLAGARASLEKAVIETQERVATRIAEAETALGSLINP